MKREDIIKASFEYKREVELIEGNFYSNINLNSVAVAFREGVDTSKASIYWARRSHGSRIDDSSKGNWFLSLQKEFMGVGFTAYEVIPTFTLQDIISMLPDSIDNNMLTIRKNANVVSVSYENLYTRSILSISQEDSLIKSSYEMLV